VVKKLAEKLGRPRRVAPVASFDAGGEQAVLFSQRARLALRASLAAQFPLWPPERRFWLGRFDWVAAEPVELSQRRRRSPSYHSDRR